LFGDGRYLPLDVTGAAADHVVAFARRRRRQWAVVVVPRLVRSLAGLGEFPIRDCWHDTSVELPDGAPPTFVDHLTGREIGVRGGRLPLADALHVLPVALLVND
jgi:(1->4)-alpha-D-glucan 1-alpha-D-glucosylmutase